MEELYYCLCDDEAGDCTGRTTTAASVPVAELSNEDVVLLAAVGLAVVLVAVILLWCAVVFVRRKCCGRRSRRSEPVGINIRVLRGSGLDVRDR
ncbi:hypothetical protein Y032_1176g3732 [Ancylostoma ceylanicum]|uniref:Uncharacterized protein n=1 Tax=Ancylostoma ceylanicum TaxID=53326 RepID=A0A016W616_9BILA|nr:hypothetical protein Y032_1176g3732 [Ancylostoma ceylanicum]